MAAKIIGTMSPASVRAIKREQKRKVSARRAACPLCTNLGDVFREAGIS